MKSMDASSTVLVSTRGPLVISGEPSTTAQEIYITVSLAGYPVVQNVITPAAPNFFWENLTVGAYTTSGGLNATFASGSDTNKVTTYVTNGPAIGVSWSSIIGGSGSFSGMLFTW